MLGLITAAALVLNAGSANLTLPSDGYTYFYRKNSTLSTEETALRSCLKEAVNFHEPGTGTAGIVAAMVGGAIEALGRNSVVAANIEDCMVAKGWNVVRLPDDLGAQLAKLNQPQLAGQLNDMITGATPKGEIVRRWNNDAANSSTKIFGPARLRERPSLSVLALDPNLISVDTISIAADDTTATASEVTGVPSNSLTSIPPGDGVILVRLTGTYIKRIWSFVRIEDGSPSDPERPIISSSFLPRAPLDVWTAKTKSSDLVLAFAVPPGRWALDSYGLMFPVAGGGTFIGVRFCYGAPAFEVGEGEVVYAGSFSSDGPNLLPDMDLAPVEISLANNPAIREKLKPATYVNGIRLPCGGLGFGYALEIPGAKFVDGYKFGSVASTEP